MYLKVVFIAFIFFVGHVSCQDSSVTDEGTVTESSDTTTTTVATTTTTTLASTTTSSTTTTVATTTTTPTTTTTEQATQSSTTTTVVTTTTTAAAPGDANQTAKVNPTLSNAAVDSNPVKLDKNETLLECGDSKCHRFSYCDNATNKCLCPNTYTNILKPVCGSNGKTYGNEGELMVKVCAEGSDVTKESDGGCTSKSESDDKSKKTLIIIIVALLVLLLILVIVVIVYKKKRTRSSNLKNNEKQTDQLL